jgi:hypothetical protein
MSMNISSNFFNSMLGTSSSNSTSGLMGLLSDYNSFRLPKPASAKYLSIRIFAILHQSSHFQTKEEDPQSTRGSSHSYYQSSWGD